MTPQTIRTLWCSGTDPGGCGKTFALVLVADWLWTKGMKRLYVDGDPGNQGTERAFEHFLKDQPVARINIQDPEDLDTVFANTAKSESDVLVDFPANSSGNTIGWWHDVASPDMFDAAGIRLVTLVPITPSGGVVSALKYMETVGPNGIFVICLNRMEHQLAPKPTKILFEEWFSVKVPQEYDVRTIEIGHLDKHARKHLSIAQCLPSQITGVEALVANRIKNWAKKVHAQFDSIGL